MCFNLVHKIYCIIEFDYTCIILKHRKKPGNLAAYQACRLFYVRVKYAVNDFSFAIFGVMNSAAENFVFAMLRPRLCKRFQFNVGNA